MYIIGIKSKHLLKKKIKQSLALNGLAPLGNIVFRTRTRTYTNPYDTEANAAGRSGRACVARAVSVERGGMGERGCARRLGEWVWV